MIRQHINTAGERGFQWRGGEITRVEGFSDAVFAFAVTLLVVSLEVPKSVHELMAVMRGFIPFGICFALLAELWYKHYLFFRRYGLQNPWTIFLNSLLLFFILFFVYPLKFLFFVILTQSSNLDAKDGRAILMVYGGGYAAVALIFALLYLHAWRQREQPQLAGRILRVDP